jgi:glycosyltransferase involved in cell wall biosynthesis
MKICLYTETALPKVGGQEYVVDALARQMTAQGHEVVVVAQYPRAPLPLNDDALPYRVIRHRRFHSTWNMISWYRFRLFRLHRKFPFEVLHCHSVHPCGYLGTFCKEQLNTTLVITSHGGDVREGNVRLQKPGLRERFATALRLADAAVSIGRFTTEGFTRLYPSTRIVEIPNGVDLKPFASPAARPEEIDPRIQSGQYVLFLGRLNQRKGADILLDAWAMCDPKVRSRMMLVVAGDGEERAPLTAQAERLGIASRVSFVGRVGGATKTWLLQNARGVCTPSRGWEAFPLVALEAFAAGKPLIATRIPGLEDRVTPGKTGWLVPPEDPIALASALSQLAAAGAPLHDFAANVRRIADAHGWPSIAARHVDLYREARRHTAA